MDPATEACREKEERSRDDGNKDDDHRERRTWFSDERDEGHNALEKQEDECRRGRLFVRLNRRDIHRLHSLHDVFSSVPREKHGHGNQRSAEQNGERRARQSEALHRETGHQQNEPGQVQDRREIVQEEMDGRGIHWEELIAASKCLP
jgi:hypothetical protein